MTVNDFLDLCTCRRYLYVHILDADTPDSFGKMAFWNGFSGNIPDAILNMDFVSFDMPYDAQGEIWINASSNNQKGE